MAPRYLESSDSRLNPLVLASHMIDMPSTAMTTQASDPVDEAVRLHDLAVAAREDRRHDEAERLARESLTIFESADPESPDVANVLLCLAGTHEDRADYAAAQSFLLGIRGTLAPFAASFLLGQYEPRLVLLVGMSFMAAGAVLMFGAVREPAPVLEAAPAA